MHEIETRVDKTQGDAADESTRYPSAAAAHGRAAEHYCRNKEYNQLNPNKIRDTTNISCL